MPLKITLIRSRRKSVSFRVTGPERLEVRAPLRTPEREIREILERHREWIGRRLAEAAERERIRPMTREELRQLKQEAARVLPARARELAAGMGLRPGKITIRAQRTRWGSCSAKGDLSLNCLLARMPEEVRDSVLVHELCHLKEMNHSPAFWREVYRAMPDYDRRNAWLKEHGDELLATLPPKGEGVER